MKLSNFKIVGLIPIGLMLFAVSCAKQESESQVKADNIVLTKSGKSVLVEVEFAEPLKESMLVNKLVGRKAPPELKDLTGHVLFARLNDPTRGAPTNDPTRGAPTNDPISGIALSAGSKGYTVNIALSTLPKSVQAYLTANSGVSLSDGGSKQPCPANDPTCGNLTFGSFAEPYDLSQAGKKLVAIDLANDPTKEIEILSKSGSLSVVGDSNPRE